MAIEVPAPPPGGESPQATALRQRVSALIHERDRANDRAERAEQQLEATRAAHRHELSVRCDGAGCRAQIGVSSADPPSSEGELARALCIVARALRWRLGRDTLRAVGQLGAGSDVAYPWAVPVQAAGDRCPKCPA